VWVLGLLWVLGLFMFCGVGGGCFGVGVVGGVGWVGGICIDTIGNYIVIWQTMGMQMKVENTQYKYNIHIL